MLRQVRRRAGDRVPRVRDVGDARPQVDPVRRAGGRRVDREHEHRARRQQEAVPHERRDHTGAPPPPASALLRACCTPVLGVPVASSFYTGWHQFVATQIQLQVAFNLFPICESRNECFFALLSSLALGLIMKQARALHCIRRKLVNRNFNQVNI